ncbi:MAG: two-component system nitrogen regulation response regulator NtrX, partial [Patescibacteria group bacterium]
RVDVRVIAATNKDLRQQIRNNQFREDLYHRLAVIIIDVPPLNERRGDIPALVDHFNKLVCNEYGVSPKKVAKEAMAALKNVNWTGNIRELRNVIERLVILSGDVITEEDVFKYVVPNTEETVSELQKLFKKFGSVDELQAFIKKEYTTYKTMSN